MPDDRPIRSVTELDKAVSFRPYGAGDLTACARMARDAWPARPALASEELKTSGMEGYVKYSFSESNWAEVAVADGAVVGFLFGRIEGREGPTTRRTDTFEWLSDLLKSTADHERAASLRLGFAWSVALTELKLKLNTPRSDAAIEMLIVDAGHRGKGIGTGLLERFLEAARNEGSTLVTVYTDDLMSNWRFYEDRGFARAATFHDNITSYYSGTPAKGIVFALELEPGQNKG